MIVPDEQLVILKKLLFKTSKLIVFIMSRIDPGYELKLIREKSEFINYIFLKFEMIKEFIKFSSETFILSIYSVEKS